MSSSVNKTMYVKLKCLGQSIPNKLLFPFPGSQHYYCDNQRKALIMSHRSKPLLYSQCIRDTLFSNGLKKAKVRFTYSIPCGIHEMSGSMAGTRESGIEQHSPHLGLLLELVGTQTDSYRTMHKRVGNTRCTRSLEGGLLT